MILYRQLCKYDNDLVNISNSTNIMHSINKFKLGLFSPGTFLKHILLIADTSENYEHRKYGDLLSHEYKEIWVIQSKSKRTIAIYDEHGKLKKYLIKSNDELLYDSIESFVTIDSFVKNFTDYHK